MHYPLERIHYENAKRIEPHRFSPLEDLLVLDTSAFAFHHSHHLIEFMARGGNIIMPPLVHAEIEDFDSKRELMVKSGRTNDTTRRLRIPLNARALLDEAKKRNRTIITPLPTDPDARSQKSLCEALAGILPKRHAYFLTKAQHAEWHAILGYAVDFHYANGKDITIEDIRNHESGAYRLLELIIEPTEGMSPTLLSQLGQMRERITSAQRQYQASMAKLLGTPALEIPQKEETLGEKYGRSFRENVNLLLLRLLGYHLEPGAQRSGNSLREDMARRFAPRPVEESADASCVLLSYLSEREPEKNRVIYAADKDIMQLLDLRKICDEHRDVRKNVYKALYITRESQRLPKQA